LGFLNYVFEIHLVLFIVIIDLDPGLSCASR